MKMVFKLLKNKTEVETEHMKLMERFGREGEAARRSSMPAVGNDGVSRRRERVSCKRRRGEERSVEDFEQEEEDCMVLSQMTSSSGIRRRYRRKQDQALMVVGGVKVPRKARSALAKGSHGNRSAGNDGVVKDQILTKEKVEARKEMKPIGSENRLPKLSKMSSGSVEEGIENEIAEVLFGLMKQSQSSKDGDRVEGSMSNLVDEDKDRCSDIKDPKTSTSEQESSHISDSELKNAEVESKQQSKEEASMLNREPKSEGVSGSTELQQEEVKQFVQEAVGEDVLQLESKRGHEFEFDLMAPPPLMTISASDNVAASVVETLQEKKIEAISQKLNESRSQDDDTKLQQQAKAIIHRLDWRSRLSVTTLQAGSSPLSQSHKRCATHHYIARNIYLHQKAKKTNSLSPTAADPAPIRDTKQDIVIANESLGSLACHRTNESKFGTSVDMNIEASKRKKLVAQQSPSQPASAGSITRGSTFEFSVGTVAAKRNPSGPSIKTELTNNASHFSSHSTLTTVATATLGGSNVTFQERPHFNEYSFPMTTPSGTTLAFKGGSSTQAVPLVNDHFYSELHHQRPHSQSQHQARSGHQKNTSMVTESSSSSSHRQLESQQLQNTQFISMQSWQSQKKHATQPLHPCKIDVDVNGAQAANSSNAPHSVYGYGQNYSVPFQPVNFTMMPYATLSSGNRIEQSQQQDLKGVFGISFGSISGNKGTGTLLNFSSALQKPTMHHNLPTTQGAHQKHHQVSEMKTESASNNPDHDRSKPVTGRSSSTSVQTLVFDKSPSNLNFTALDSHQQRIYQFELQQQQRQARSTQVYPQSLVQRNTSIQSPSDSRRPSISQVPATNSTVNSFLQQQGRAPQVQTQISFGGNPTSSLAVVTVSQGQRTNPSLLTT